MLKNIFAYGGPILIAMGITKLFLYYSFFNIEITRFITISEVLTYFTTDLILYVLIIGVVFIGTYIVTNPPKLKYKREFINYCQVENIFLRFFEYMWQSGYAVTIMGAYILYEIFLYNLSYLSGYSGYLVTIIFFNFLALWSIREIKRKGRINNKLKKEDSQYEIFSYFLLRILSAICMYTVIEAQRVKYEERYINTQILLDDRKITCDSTIFYVGNTSNYIFIYDLKKDQSTIFPMTRVKELNFGNINYIPRPKKKYTPREHPG